jgi:5'-3' exonuclease
MVTIIDADSIIWICHWDTVFKNWYKPKERIANDIDALVSKILIETKAQSYLGFLGESRGFRAKEFPDYKSNRANVERPPYLAEFKQYLVDNWGFILLNEFEPDDAVSILKKRNPDWVISAIDKDILNNIEGSHYNYKKHEWVNTSFWDKERHFWSQMITGDTADGIKGIPKSGDKVAEKVVNEFLEGKKQFYEIVLNRYIKHFGEYEGIKEFHKNYILLKMLEEYEGFEPTPINVDFGKLRI